MPPARYYAHPRSSERYLSLYHRSLSSGALSIQLKDIPATPDHQPTYIQHNGRSTERQAASTHRGASGLTGHITAVDTTGASDPLEQAEAKKEKGDSTTGGIIHGQEAIDEAIGDDGEDIDPVETTAQDDPLEEAEAAKEAKAQKTA